MKTGTRYTGVMSGLELVASVGALQGTLLFLLVGLRYRRVENLPLAALLVVYSARLATIPLWNPGSMQAHPWLLPLTTPLPFLFGPLLWAYARALRGTPLPWRSPRALLHLAPYVVDVTYTSLLALEIATPDYPAMIAAIFAGAPPRQLLIRNAAKVVLNAVYVVLAIRLAFRSAPATRTTSHQRLWLRWLVTAPLVSLVLFAGVALRPSATARLAGGEAGPFVSLAVAMAVLIYVFSFLMLVAPEVPSGEPGRPDRRGAGHSGVITDEERRIAARADSYLASGAFRDPDLTLDRMAAAVGVHPNRLSRAVNAVHGTHVPGLLHRYRIDYFLARSREGALTDRTVLDLAFDAGFSSKSTFNRVFKESMGISPTDFRSRLTRPGERRPSPPDG